MMFQATTFQNEIKILKKIPIFNIVSM